MAWRAPCTWLHPQCTSTPSLLRFRPLTLPTLPPPAATQTAAANEQHYEVPTAYFLLVLGKHLKYSSCLYPGPNSSLEEAEAAMLGGWHAG